jgi:argininosuccinate lyase
LAEALVERGMPFRQAHQVVGRLVAGLIAAGRSPGDVTMADLADADPRFVESDLGKLDPMTSLARRKTPGSGTPLSISDQIEKIRAIVEA